MEKLLSSDAIETKNINQCYSLLTKVYFIQYVNQFYFLSK